MRRSVFAYSFGSLVVVIAVFIATWGTSSGSPVNYLPQASTPVTVQEPTGVAVTDLGTLPIPTPTPATPGAEPSSDEYVLRLKRVDLWLEASPVDEDTHTGLFVLTVDTGAICYTLVSKNSADTVVTAWASQDVVAPNECQTADLDCTVEGGCELAVNDTVYLPAGSTVTQTGTTEHLYRNVDPDMPAVVYLAEYQEEGDDAGCGGGCM